MQSIHGFQTTGNAVSAPQVEPSISELARINPQTQLMKQAATPPLHMPDIKGRTFNMPELVSRLNLLIKEEQTQSIESEHTYFKKLILSDIDTPAKAAYAFIDTFLNLDRLLHDREGASEALKKKCQATFNNKSAIVSYASDLHEQFKDSEQLILQMINTSRSISVKLLKAPEFLVLKTLDHFPPPAIDLKCFDGTETRFENSHEQLEQEMIELGLIPPKELQQMLNRSGQSQLALTQNILIESSYESGVAQEVYDEFNVHIAKALLLKLGVNPELYQASDRYAVSALNTVSGENVYDTLNLAEKNLYTRLTDIILSKTGSETLSGFQNALKNLKNPEKLKEDAEQLKAVVQDHRIIQKYLEDPFTFKLQELKKSPLVKKLMESHPDQTLEQVYGQWNDTTTVLENWDWQSLNQRLSNIVDQDWALINTENLMLHHNSYDEINGMAPDFIAKLIEGQCHDYDQHHALMYMLNKLSHADFRGQISSLADREDVLKILTGTEHLPEHEHTTVPDYINSKLNATKNRATPAVNVQMLNQLQNRLEKVFGTTYPYSTAPIKDIRDSFKQFKLKQPMSLLKASLIFDREIPLDEIKSYASNYIEIQDVNTLSKQLTPIIKNLITEFDQDIPDFINALTDHKQDLKNKALEQLVIQQIRQNQTHKNFMNTFMTSKSSLVYWFPDVLKSDAIFKAFPQLPKQLFEYAIEKQNPEICGLLVQSREAVNNLAQTLNKDSFTEVYLNMINTDLRAGQRIINEFILPLFKHTENLEDLVYIASICNSLSHADRHYLGHHRGAMLEHAMNDHTDWRHHLICTMLTALPRVSTQPLAGLIYLHIHEGRQDPMHLVNIFLAGNGINTWHLAHLYPVKIKAADHFSQILYAASEPEYDRSYGSLMSISTGIGHFMQKMIGRNKKLFLEALTHERFPMQCLMASQQMERRFGAIFNRLPKQLQQDIKIELQNAPEKLKANMPLTIRLIIDSII